MDFQITTHPHNAAWDSYVCSQSKACLYHLSGWLRVIQQTYGHPVYSFALTESAVGSIVGVLPLVHMRHFLFGNSLVSMPFLDMGGVLADSPEVEKCLIDHVLKLAQRLGVSVVELRHAVPSALLSDSAFPEPRTTRKDLHCRTSSHKVRMLLDFPGSSEALLKSFKSKLRSQINRAIKDGLQAKCGGKELVGEFYEVFLENMRDLGSPVHSKRLIENVMAEFSGRACIFIVHLNGRPLAASLAIGFKEVLANPWASALRRCQQFSPNMLLYWKMLEYGADNGYRLFDFGRSSPGEGTFRFKEQWGAYPVPLYWQYIGEKIPRGVSGGIGSFKTAAAVWKRLPIRVTEVMGPLIRKHISL